ncbi:aspartate:alanine exchanger family transporter [Ruegeria lacuscaerulensis]|uniref:aspartate:alanine exchanger family transporter n=1 Tax=Ruegeria lacuscaerulensis TaxID=55218 RepID=UPI001480FB5B|nr:TrkA C-terminal domain-containing protein [Ruegeria lacuscaerulensis]
MTIDFFQLFSANSVLVVFTIIAIGYVIGNVKIGQFEIGITGGVLLCALVFGHFGFQIDPIVQSIGFTLFIYSVGWQAGPQIINVLRQDGLSYLTIALFMSLGSFALVVGLALVVDLENALAAGLMAGALTSTPTLVGAQNAVEAGLVPIPAGSTSEAIIESISVGYAITYIFGTVGLLLLVKLLPSLLKIDLVEKAQDFAKERGFVAEDSAKEAERPILRAYEVPSIDYEKKTVAQASSDFLSQYQDYGAIYKLKRGNDIIDVSPDTTLEPGDKLAFFCSPKLHEKIREEMKLGREVLDEDLVDAVVDVVEVVVNSSFAVGQTIGQLAIQQEHGCRLTRLTRSQIEMPLSPSTRVQRGDVMYLTGERAALQQLVSILGVEERAAVETDLLTFAAGIVVGLFIGQITVRIGGIDVGIGNAGGLLVSGIAVGFLRANRPTFGRMPAAARFILMELGLLFFMVGVGLNAGGGIIEALGAVGPKLFLCGVVVTCIPLLAGYAFGRIVLNMNPALLLGALTGAMTSTPALGIVQQAAKSSVPSLGYAGTYALANVLLTALGTLIMLL